MSAAGLVSALETQFNQEFQARANGYWELRNADAHGHEDKFLSVSWQGSIKYLAARHYHRAKAAADRQHAATNLPGDAPDPDKALILNQFGFAQPKRGFFRCLFRCFLKDEEPRSNVYEDGPYHLDCTIYHKASHIEPDSLRKLFGLSPNGPSSPVGVVPGFADVPLNHFYMVRREEPVRMRTPPPNVQTIGVLEISQVHFRDQAALVLHLAEEIYPKSLIEKVSGGFCRWLSCLIWRWIVPVIVLIGLGIAAYLNYPPFRERVDEMWRDFNPILVRQLREEVGELEERLDHLQTEYVELIDERDLLLEAIGRDSTEEALEELALINERLEVLEEEMVDVIEQVGHAGLDDPPCWETWANGDRQPVYLFDVFVGREGVLVSTSEGAAERAVAEGWPVDRLPRGRVITLDEFARGAAPIYALSQSQSCRHFIVLREGEHDSAAQYQAQRDMIERYFYIYRP